MSTKIIAGEFKGVRIDVPKSARATLLRARQSLFDMLNSLRIDRNIREFFKDKVALDCFAGSGAVGMEALSRGARHAYFVDINEDAVKTIKSNIAKARAEKRSTVIRSDILKIKKFERECEFVFLDPPFLSDIDLKKVIRRLIKIGSIGLNTVVTIETAGRLDSLPEFQLIIERTVGTISFSVWKLHRNVVDMNF